MAATVACMADDEWGIFGEFNDWDASSRVMMTKTAENVYTVTMGNLQGRFKFVIDDDWTLTYGAKDIDKIYGNGEVKIGDYGPDFIASDPLENVTITLDMGRGVVGFSGLPTDMEVPSLAEPVITEGHFIIGTTSDKFNPQYGLSMNEVAEGVYQWRGQITESMIFSFTTALVDNMEDPWPFFNAHRYGLATSEDAPLNGEFLLPQEKKVKICYPMVGDMSWKVEETGLYKFTLDSKELTLNSENLTQWVICGDYNNWDKDGEDISMTPLGEGKWEASATDFSGEFRFKIINTELSIGPSGDRFVSVNRDNGCSWNYGVNFLMEQPAEHIRFLLDTNNLLLTTTISTSIISGICDDEIAEYYNLQGIRVANPESGGVYIRVSPSGSRKVKL